jgi:hypothetical protein
MMTPEPLPNESPKAYRALALYVEQGENRSMRKLARQLHCSCQNLSIWARKYGWQDRIAAQQLRECQQKIAAEERATEQQAEITEARRARVAERAFSVAEKFIEHADAVMERHPIAAVRLLSTGCDVAKAVCGVARDYQAPLQFHIETQYIDAKTGQSTELPRIDSITEAEEILHASESKRALPANSDEPRLVAGG